LTLTRTGLLRRHPHHHHPRHFRIEPTNTVGTEDKIRGVEKMPPYKIQYRAIDIRPLGLHPVDTKAGAFFAVGLHWCR
jgi:hypothetical protein